nr:hypothetical protein [uncultured Pseudomonas sp.]
MDFYEENEIQESLETIEKIVNSGIFNPKNTRTPFFRPSFVALLISLRDLMYKAEKYASRIDFSDDVDQRNQVLDVSGLIKFVRDALCHPDSDNHYLENGAKATFNVVFGAGCVAQIGDFRQESEYPDDVCFFFGMHRIYLKRHIIRAAQEAQAKLDPLMSRRM